MLRFVAFETDAFVERMRFRTDDVATDRNLFQSAAARPFLDRFDQTAADSFPAFASPDDEPTDFAVSSDFQKFVVRGVNPARDFGCFRDEHNVIFSLEKTLQPFLHHAGFHGITELRAQSRDRRRVLSRCFADVQCTHETNFELLCRGILH